MAALIDYREIFHLVICDPCYQSNLDCGKARSGHSDFSVRAHIAELESNLEVLSPKLNDQDYWKLKLLIHTHDAFRGNSEPGVPSSNPRSCASLARQFLSIHCKDDDLLAMVQLQEDPLALYRETKTIGKYDQRHFNALLNAIEDWNLFLAFIIIDGCTPGKSRDPLSWFLLEVGNKVASRFTIADIIPG